MPTPALVIVYDEGAASATEITASLSGTAEPVFLVRDSPHNRSVRPVLATLGPVLDSDGDSRADAEALARFAPRGVLTFSEPTLRHTAELAGVLGLPGHATDTAWLLTDKTAQRTRLAEAGVDAVRHARVDRAEEWTPALARVGLPAVVKPAWGGGSVDTHLFTDADVAARLRTELFDPPGPPRGFVVEEFLVGRPSAPFGDYVSVESLCGQDGPVHVAVTGKFPLAPPFRERGQFWPDPLEPALRRRVLDLTGAALAALGVRTGMTHTEIKLTADGPRVIEVNGRLGGNLPDLAVRSGVGDLVLACARAALGQPVALVPARPDRVYFQYMCLAPTQPGTMTAAHGIRTVRKIPGITAYRASVRPGDTVAGGVRTARLGQLYGVADDHDAMFGILAAARAELSFQFVDTVGVPFTLTRP